MNGRPCRSGGRVIPIVLRTKSFSVRAARVCKKAARDHAPKRGPEMGKLRTRHHAVRVRDGMSGSARPITVLTSVSMMMALGTETENASTARTGNSTGALQHRASQSQPSITRLEADKVLAQASQYDRRAVLQVPGPTHNPQAKNPLSDVPVSVEKAKMPVPLE